MTTVSTSDTTQNCHPFENDMDCCTPWNKCGYGIGDCDYDTWCGAHIFTLSV